METKDIILIILVIIVLYLLVCNNNNETFKKNTLKKIDNFTTSESENITITESIKNLGIIARELQNNNGDWTFPAHLNVTGDLNIEENVIGDVKFADKNTAWIDILPKFMIVMWYGDNCPKGWAPCDGQTYRLNSNGVAIRSGTSGYDSSDSSTQITTPNLHGRMPIGSSGISSYGIVGFNQTNNFTGDGGNNAGWPDTWRYAKSQTGGQRTVVLSYGQMPQHKHLNGSYRIADSGGAGTGPEDMNEISYGRYGGVYYSPSHPNGLNHDRNNQHDPLPINPDGTGFNKQAGSNQYCDPLGRAGTCGRGIMFDYSKPEGNNMAHNNMPPYMVLHFIIKL